MVTITYWYYTMTPTLTLFLGNRNFNTQAQRIVAIHTIGYVLRQKVYEEALSGGQMLKQIQELMTTDHHSDIWYLSIVPCLLVLAVRDLQSRKSFVRVRQLQVSKEVIQLVEFVTLVMLIIFTKDVENAI